MGGDVSGTNPPPRLTVSLMGVGVTAVSFVLAGILLGVVFAEAPGGQLRAAVEGTGL